MALCLWRPLIVLLAVASLCAPAPATPIVRPDDDPPKGALPVRMIVRLDKGNPCRLYVPIEVDGSKKLAIVDCGTSRFWLELPQEEGKDEWADDAFVVTMGGQRLHVLGRRVPPFQETAEGQAAIGAIGNDYLLAGTLLLDLREGTLQRLPRGTPVPEAAKWPAVPFALKRGIIVLDARFDLRRVRVMLDTGAADSIWKGQTGKRGDVRGETNDVHGNPLPYWLGTMRLQLGGGLLGRKVPVMRMKALEHLDEIARAIGEKLDGIVGLTSLGRRRVIIDPVRQRILLEPLTH